MANAMHLNFVGTDRTGKEVGLTHIVSGLRKHVSEKSQPRVAGIVAGEIQGAYKTGFGTGVLFADRVSADDKLFAEFITSFMAQTSITQDQFVAICEDLSIDPNKMRTIYKRAKQLTVRGRN